MNEHNSAIPATMGREIQRVAAAEGRTVSELLRETFHQYQREGVSALWQHEGNAERGAWG